MHCQEWDPWHISTLPSYLHQDGGCLSKTSPNLQGKEAELLWKNINIIFITSRFHTKAHLNANSINRRATPCKIRFHPNTFEEAFSRLGFFLVPDDFWISSSQALHSLFPRYSKKNKNFWFSQRLWIPLENCQHNWTFNQWKWYGADPHTISIIMNAINVLSCRPIKIN